MSPARQNQPWWRSKGEDHTPPAARGPGSRRPFGATWWGRAWISALEDRAALDPNRLPRGRSYARRGTVDELQITTGLVLAKVQGSRATPYSVTVRVQVFSDQDWDRVLDVVAGQLGHTAALLDSELPPEVTDDVAAAGLDLLPGPGDVEPRCSCPDVADPCKHSVAVCYVMADALDADPFDLLLLRGRSREQVLAGLRSRRTSGSSAADEDPNGPATTDAGLVAREVFAAVSGDGLPEVPRPPMPADRPGRPASLGSEPPAASGVAVSDLSRLAADAVGRAWSLATGASAGELGLAFDEDLARWAAGLLGSPEFDRLAARAGVPPRELTSRAIAWREAGPGGVRALLDSWKPSTTELAEGKAALTDSAGADRDAGGASGAGGLGGGRPVRVRANRVSAGDRQLRLGTDRLWYPFVKSNGSWELAGPSAADPEAIEFL